MSVNTDVAQSSTSIDHAGLAFATICTGALMVVLDSTIVMIALPSIGRDLQISTGSLSWLLNAYMLTFGGALLLAGRLADLYGTRRLLLIGVSAFSLASLACGLSSSATILIGSRAAQGLAGACVMAVALSLIVRLFPTREGRARALGVYGAVCTLGNTVGALLGGILISILNWHWIFLVNVPLGMLLLLMCRSLLPDDTIRAPAHTLDIGGALTLTLGTGLVVYILSVPDSNWPITAVSSVAMFALFGVIERRASHPIVPPGALGLSTFRSASVIALLWAAGSYGGFTIAALYMQRTLGCTPLEMSLYFLPNTVLGAVVSVTGSKYLVGRYGAALPTWVGILLFAAGLAWLSHPPSTRFLTNILPAMILLGLGDGIGSGPLLVAALEGVSEEHSGIASGVINTAWVLGGAFGIAGCLGVSELWVQYHSDGLPIAVAGSGYGMAFAFGACVTACAALCAALSFRKNIVATRESPE